MIKVLYCNRCIGPTSVVAIVMGELALESNDIDQKLTSHSNREHAGMSNPHDFYWSETYSSEKKAQGM